MIVDTSAVVAVVLGESTRQEILNEIARTPSTISSMSLLEAGIVLRSRRGETAIPNLYDLIEMLGVEVAPFDESLARLAIATFGRFGKGMGHKAQLNFGDCAVYALAVSRGEPVLATGKDFTSTDIVVIRP